VSVARPVKILSEQPAIIKTISIALGCAATAVVAPYLAPYLAVGAGALFGEIVKWSFDTEKGLGKLTLDAIAGFATEKGGSELDKLSGIWSKEHNYDLEKALATAYLESLEQLSSEATTDELKKQFAYFLPLWKARIAQGLEEKDGCSLFLSPVDADSFSITEFINELSEPDSAKTMLAVDAIRNLRRWAASAAADNSLQRLGLTDRHITEPLLSCLHAELPKKVTHQFGQIVRGDQFKRSWIAFQQAHMQATSLALRRIDSSLLTVIEKIDRLASQQQLLEAIAEGLSEFLIQAREQERENNELAEKIFEQVIQVTREENEATRQTVRESERNLTRHFDRGFEDLRKLVIPLSATPLTEAQQQERAKQMHARLNAYYQGRIAKWSEPDYALDERFVNLTLLRDAGRDQQERWQEPPQQSRFHNLNEALAVTKDDPAIVLLGAPGSGKSTLLRHLQLQHCQAQMNQATGAISLLADLNEYHGERAPREWLAQLWQRRAPDLAELMPLDLCLKKGSVLLLLDALNEMSAKDQTYAELVGQWQEFIRQDERRNRIVFTCRSLDYSETLSSDGFTVPHLRVQPMDPDQMRKFIDEYAPTQAQSLWDKLDKAPPEQRLFELYQTPFYLRMLCEQVEARGEFPTGRAALFTGFVRQALQEEKEKRNSLLQSGALLTEHDCHKITNKLWSDDPFALPEEGCLILKLSELAFKMQRKDKLTQSTQVSVSRQQARDFLADDANAEAIFKAGCALKILDEKNDGATITFFHQLIQEYFAARQLARQPEPALTHVEWEVGRVSEALAETLARIQDYEPLPSLAQTGWEVTTEIAAPMADDVVAFIRDLMPHNLPLAARCAVSPELKISDELRELKKQLQDALLKRATDRRPAGWRRLVAWFKPQADLRARIAAGEALGLLGHPHFTRHTGQFGEYLLPPFAPIPGDAYLIGDDKSEYPDEKPARRVPLAPFSIGVYPVTNAEYELFIRAGGYENEQWWDTPAAREWLTRGGRAAERARIRGIRDHWKRQGEEALRASTNTSQHKDYWARYIAMTDTEFEELLDQAKPLETAPPRQPEFWNDPRFNQPTQPVVGVTWHEARAYCNWLTASVADGRIYRLPTEAEFEAAARGKEERQFSYGNTFAAERCNTFESHIRRTTPVGIFDNATPEGAYDLSGNAWTWTLSLYQNYPYDADDGRENIEAEGNRVLRGGSWDDLNVYARAACRLLIHPASRGNFLGFRLLLLRPPSL
jgi:formylglycine-generating enzyme required for sulfatase activity